jgi:hypothetical protein
MSDHITPSLPTWIEQIRTGDFQGAQNTVATGAADQIRMDQLQKDMARAVQETPNGEWIAASAVVMTQNDYQSGRIQSHDQALAAFQRNLERESKRFQENVRPQEVDKATNDYFAQRRSQERRAKGLQE